jgi:acetyl esterase/lipase
MPTDRKVWQPLHPSVRPNLHPQYVAFHDAHIQYVQPDNTKPWDGSARTDPSLPPGGFPTVEVGSIADVDVDVGGEGGSSFKVRVYTPPEGEAATRSGERDVRGWPALLWLHGGGWAIGGLDDRKDFCTWVCRGTFFFFCSLFLTLTPDP